MHLENEKTVSFKTTSSDEGNEIFARLFMLIGNSSPNQSSLPSASVNRAIVIYVIASKSFKIRKLAYRATWAISSLYGHGATPALGEELPIS